MMSDRDKTLLNFLRTRMFKAETEDEKNKCAIQFIDIFLSPSFDESGMRKAQKEKSQ